MPISRRAFVGGTPALFLAGCTSGSGVGSASRTVAFESLVRQIKHDVGTYLFQHQNDDPPPAKTQPCAGQIEIAIQSIKITVTATVDKVGGVGVGLKVPINVSTLEGGFDASRTLNDTITTSLVIFPISGAEGTEFEDASVAAQRLVGIPPAPPEFQGTPIADALNQLRNDLIKTANTAPCFNFGQGDQDSNLVKWAFSVSDKAKGGGKLSLLLFSVGAEGTYTQALANTIEAKFIASGEGFG